MSRVRLAVGVVSTRERADLLRRTLAALDDGEWVETITDRAQAATVNMLAAWQVLADDPRATHALLLHDDLNASHGWRDAATAFAARFPDQQLTALYTPRNPILARTVDRRPGYVRLSIRQWSHDQAVLMPTPIVRRYLRWVANKAYRPHMTPKEFLHHDRLLATFHKVAGGRIAYLTDPPVFQHMGDGHEAQNQSKQWRGRDFDAGGHFRHTLITA